MRKLHRIAAFLAVTMVALFWTSTIAVEVMGTTGQIAVVKQSIVYGLGLLIPAMAVTGMTGARLARGRVGPAVAAKRRRMPWIAANGLLILTPAALYLNDLAATGAFGLTFYAVQAIELIAGVVNLRLMTANLLLGRHMVRQEATARALSR